MRREDSKELNLTVAKISNEVYHLRAAWSLLVWHLLSQEFSFYFPYITFL